jgi:elongation factor Ts
MAEITAKLVNELRAKTGQGMMECKKALTETGGDIDKAVDYFRKKGVKTSVAGRAATEGRVGVKASADGKRAAIVEINCNTDFTAKSEPIQRIIAQALDLLLSDASGNVAENAQIKDRLTQAAQQTGENVRLGRAAVLSSADGRVGTYLYSVTGKIAVMVAIGGTPADDLVRDLCLHVIAKNPLALSREQLPPALVAKEREIAIEQAKATGKPQQIAEKIAEGKMRTFYEERVMLDQKFVRPEIDKTIAQLLKENNCTIEKYVRVEVGQAA